MDSPHSTDERADRPVAASAGNGSGLSQPHRPAPANASPSRETNPASAGPPRPDAGQTVLAIMRIVVFLWVGLVLTVLPWQDRWTQNTVLLSRPALHAFFASYFVRGAFSGLGLLDLWIAVTDAARLRR